MYDGRHIGGLRNARLQPGIDGMHGGQRQLGAWAWAWAWQIQQQTWGMADTYSEHGRGSQGRHGIASHGIPWLECCPYTDDKPLPAAGLLSSCSRQALYSGRPRRSPLFSSVSSLFPPRHPPWVSQAGPQGKGGGGGFSCPIASREYIIRADPLIVGKPSEAAHRRDRWSACRSD